MIHLLLGQMQTMQQQMENMQKQKSAEEEGSSSKTHQVDDEDDEDMDFDGGLSARKRGLDMLEKTKDYIVGNKIGRKPNSKISLINTVI